MRPRVALAAAGLIAAISLFFNRPGPEFMWLHLRNYAWALPRTLQGLPIYLTPVPWRPAGEAVYYTPPPQASLLGGTFGGLPVLWASINLLAIVLTVWLLLDRSDAHLGGWRALGLAVVSSVLFGPVVWLVLIGDQLGVVILMIGLGTWSAWRDRPALGAGLITVAASLKLFPLGILCSGIGRGRFRYVLGAIVAGGLVVAATISVFGVAPIADFVHASGARAPTSAGREFNVSPLAAILPSPLVFVGIPITAAVGLLLGLGDQPRPIFAKTVAVTLVAWPVLWYQYAAIALLAMAAVLSTRTWRWLLLSFCLFQVGSAPINLLAAACLWMGASRHTDPALT